MSMRRDAAGFTLLEVMAAFMIAALATIVLLRAGFTGAAQNAVAAQYQQAAARAQSRMASFGVLTALQAETLSGDDGGGYHWQARISALQSSGKLTLYRIDLTESIGARDVTLTTERLGTGG